MTIEEKIAQYREDFDLFDSADEKFEYLFDLGKKHTLLSQNEKNDQTFIAGCSSPAWLVAEHEGGVLHLRGEGTSEMAKGMLVLLLYIFDGRSPAEILDFDPAGLDELGIIDLMSPVRQQSMEAFLTKLYSYAEACASWGQSLVVALGV
jgi:cysteine desulfuration protein SufE